MLVFSSVVSDCDPMNQSTPGLPVHHQLLESTQTHVHWVGDTIWPSHPLLSPSPPAFNLPQHQGLFKWVSSSHQVAKALEFQPQHQSFQWTPRTSWEGLYYFCILLNLAVFLWSIYPGRWYLESNRLQNNEDINNSVIIKLNKHLWFLDVQKPKQVIFKMIYLIIIH